MKNTFKWLMLLILVVHFTVQAYAKVDEQREVRAVIHNYINGTSNGEPELIKKAFHERASLLLSHPNKAFWQVSAEDYASWFESAKWQRAGAILSVTIDGDIAMARALITTASPVKQYIDQFLLKRFPKGWQMVIYRQLSMSKVP